MGARFQVLFHSPPGVLFTFPSRYWCAIGHREYSGLEGGPPGFGPGFTCPALLRDRVARPVWVRVRGSHPLRPAFPCRSAPQPDLRPGRQPRMRGLQPVGGTPAGYARSTVWPRSPFARRYSGNLEVDFFSSGYLDVSVPRVPPRPMCSLRGYATAVHGFAVLSPPGRRMLLAGDYRSLPRPSSTSDAKASAVRPWYLAGPHRARGISTCR